MIRQLRIYFNQGLEVWKTTGFYSVLNKVFFLNKEIVIVEKDLNSLEPLPLIPEKMNIKFIEINKEQTENTLHVYSLKSRHLKMLNNLDRGYKGFAIVKGNEVIGDIWYVSPTQSKTVRRDPDLKLYNINLNEKDVYMFDMYLKPEERGGGKVNFLLRNVLNALKEMGFIKVYGYYMADNLPALWVHRMLGYKELKRFKVQRILFVNFKSFKKLVVAI
jgi:hypothetical protein